MLDSFMMEGVTLHDLAKEKQDHELHGLLFHFSTDDTDLDSIEWEDIQPTINVTCSDKPPLSQIMRYALEWAMLSDSEYTMDFVLNGIVDPAEKELEPLGPTAQFVKVEPADVYNVVKRIVETMSDTNMVGQPLTAEPDKTLNSMVVELAIDLDMEEEPIAKPATAEPDKMLNSIVELARDLDIEEPISKPATTEPDKMLNLIVELARDLGMEESRSQPATAEPDKMLNVIVELARDLDMEESRSQPAIADVDTLLTCMMDDFSVYSSEQVVSILNDQELINVVLDLEEDFAV